MNKLYNLEFWVGIAIIFSTTLFISPPDQYYFDLLQSFAFQAFWAYGVIAIILLFHNKWSIGGAFAGASLLLFVYLQMNVSTYPAASPDAKGAELKVAHFNVLINNTEYEKTLNKAIDTDADLLSFQEVDTAWGSFLEAHLTDKYPYYHLAPVNRKGEGVAIFSRYPLCNVKTICWGNRPNIAGDIQIDNKYIHFLAAHTISPRSKDRFHQRKIHLEHITKYLRKQETPVLAIGDFNIVPWNRQIINLKQKAQLIDSRVGRQPTYPAYMGKWGIPIDYIFYSDELECLNFGTIHGTGSDHLGVQGTYQFRESG